MSEAKNEVQRDSANLERVVMRELNHTKCHDCGLFLRKDLWVPKDHSWKRHALCRDCLSNYDSPHDY